MDPKPRFSAKSTRPPVIYAHTKAQALDLLRELKKEAEGLPVAVDTEFDPRTNKIALMSYSWARGVRRVVKGKWVRLFKSWLEDKRNMLVYQNYAADCVVFKEMGINPDRSFHADVMVMDWLIDENERRHGLKHQSGRWLRWSRREYSDLFSYIPEGKKKPKTMDPATVMWGPRPPEALEKMTPAQWKDIMLNYSGDDAESTIALYHHHRSLLENEDYWDTYLKLDKPFTLTLMKCQERGVQLNLERLRAILREVSIEELRYTHSFRANAGKPDLNLRSVAQLKKLFFDELEWPVKSGLVTATGEPQISAEALHYWANEEGYLLAELLLGFRSIATLRGTFLEGLLMGVDEDGRLRSAFNQIGTNTGRISSRKRLEKVEVTRTLKSGKEKTIEVNIKKGANLQNIPTSRKDSYGIRACFVAPKKGDITAKGEVAKEDHTLICADFTGFELYMGVYNAAKFSPSSEMLKAAQKGANIHCLTAWKMGLVPKSKRADAKAMIDAGDWKAFKKLLGDKLYDIAKRCNFNLLYGGQKTMLARLLGMDYREMENLMIAQDYIDSWKDAWPEMPVYQKGIVKMGYKMGYVETISGRRVHVKEGLSLRDRCNCREWNCDTCGMLAYWERKCMNTPCQGSAADVVKAAMNLIERDTELADLGASQLLQVHDEIIVESPISVAPVVLERVLHHMKTPYQAKLGFILPVEGKYAANWQLAK